MKRIIAIGVIISSLILGACEEEETHIYLEEFLLNTKWTVIDHHRWERDGDIIDQYPYIYEFHPDNILLERRLRGLDEPPDPNVERQDDEIWRFAYWYVDDRTNDLLIAEIQGDFGSPYVIPPDTLLTNRPHLEYWKITDFSENEISLAQHKIDGEMLPEDYAFRKFLFR